MAARVGFFRLSAFSNISCKKIPIDRRIASRNLHSLSKSPGVGISKTTTNSSLVIIGKYSRSTLFSSSYGLLSSKIQTPSFQRSLSMFVGILHHSKIASSTEHIVKPAYGNMENRFTVIARNINIMSKRGKRKTCKAVAKRVHRTGKGKLKRWRAGKNHGMIRKSNKRRKQLKKPTYCNKQQLKLLNKMLNGW
ncbi:50S ribosomal protein L35, chloroplastic-like [Actinia tenebrosa]|uniref:50S ribosomal protein L35 n=1 Tax=Actinia tenebrosa TaxID=6105 RepID=A0A6P8J5I1_ACTTE|nr:50S ribosomal protein L35, chloroplastic-like [Actinia tenebrosa]